MREKDNVMTMCEHLFLSHAYQKQTIIQSKHKTNNNNTAFQKENQNKETQLKQIITVQ
jgi:hypothetical protein